MSESIFAAEHVGFRYADSPRDAVEDVSLAVRTGDFVAVLGPNGSGKSTLARLLTGTLRPTRGRALYRGVEAHSISRRAFARDVGVVPQSETHAFPMSVRDVVVMGRYPHLGPWRGAGADDQAAIGDAMERCDVAELADRSVASLSGGERQRVFIARALAQQPRALVLDEPTAALDVRHEMGIFELLRALCADGVTVLLVTHNLNLAARYADRLLLLDRGRVAAVGAPGDVLRASIIEQVYRWPVAVRPLDFDRDAPHVVPLRPDGSR